MKDLFKFFARANRAVLVMLFFGMIFASCQTEKLVLKPDDQKQVGTITVQDGRLFFSSKEIYSATINKELLNKPKESCQNWSSKFNFESLSNFPTKPFTGLSHYKYLLNKDYQVRVDDMIIKIAGDSVYNVPADRKDLIALLDKAPDSPELIKYKFSPYNKIKALDNSNARLATGYFSEQYDPENTYAGTNTGNTQFRYFISLNIYCDGANVNFYIENSLQYFWSGHGWYYASEYAHIQILQFTYTYQYYPSAGYTQVYTVYNSPGAVNEGTSSNNYRIRLAFYSYPNVDGHADTKVSVDAGIYNWFRSDNIQFPDFNGRALINITSPQS